MGEGSCAAAPFRANVAAIKWIGGCPAGAECCSEYGYCRAQAEWAAGAFRDCNGISNGRPLAPEAIDAENQAAALGDVSAAGLIVVPAGANGFAAAPVAVAPVAVAPAAAAVAGTGYALNGAGYGYAAAPAAVGTGYGYAAAIPAAVGAGYGYAAVAPAAVGAGYGYAAAAPAAVGAGYGYAAAAPAGYANTGYVVSGY